MLSRCPEFTTLVALTKQALGGLTPELSGECWGADGLLGTWTLPKWDTFEITVAGETSTTTVTNIVGICRAGRRRFLSPVTHIKYVVKAGGNTWELLSPLTLSNPEAVSNGFANLFRTVINERNHQP